MSNAIIEYALNAFLVGLVTLTYGALVCALVVVTTMRSHTYRGLMVLPIVVLVCACVLFTMLAVLMVRSWVRAYRRRHLDSYFNHDIEQGANHLDSDQEEVEDDDVQPGALPKRHIAALSAVIRSARTDAGFAQADDIDDCECPICMDSVIDQCVTIGIKPVQSNESVKVDIETRYSTPLSSCPQCTKLFHTACLLRAIVSQSPVPPSCPMCKYPLHCGGQARP